MKRNFKTLCDVSFSTDDFKLEANPSEHRASLREFPVFCALKAVEQLFFFCLFSIAHHSVNQKSPQSCVCRKIIFTLLQNYDLFVVVFFAYLLMMTLER
jgi:hypothetical protein